MLECRPYIERFLVRAHGWCIINTQRRLLPDFAQFFKVHWAIVRAVKCFRKSRQVPKWHIDPERRLTRHTIPIHQEISIIRL